METLFRQMLGGSASLLTRVARLWLLSVVSIGAYWASHGHWVTLGDFLTSTAVCSVIVAFIGGLPLLGIVAVVGVILGGLK